MRPLFRSSFGRLLTISATVVIVVGGTPLRAASNSWAVAADGLWTTVGNWTGGVNIPGSTSADNADVATFSTTLTAHRVVTVDSPRFIGGISFGNTSAFRYTLSGGALNLNNTGVIQTLAANGAHTDTISTPITLSSTSGGTAVFTANATATTSLLSIGAVSGSAATGTTTLTLNGTNTGTNAITGIISDGLGGGNLALTKAAAGNWTLSGANTYTGLTTVSAGSLIYGASDVINTGNVTVSGGTLSLLAFSDSVGTVTLTSGTISSSTGVLTGNGNFDMRSGTASAKLAGSVALNKTTSGTVVLSGANTYTGVTTVGAGMLQFAKQTSLYNNLTASWTAANIEVASGATAAFNVGGTGEFTTGNVTTLLGNLTTSISDNGLKAGSAIGFDTTNAAGSTFTVGSSIADSTGTGAGTLGVTKLGTNTLVLSSTNTYTGVTTITAGTLSVATIGNGGVAGNLGQATNAAAKLILGGGTLQYTGATASSDRNFTLAAGTTNTIGVATGATNLTLSGASAATTGALTKSGAGTLTLTGANLHTGITSINAGTLALSGGNNRLASTSTVSFGGSATLDVGSTTQTLAGLSSAVGSFTQVIEGGGGSINVTGIGPFYIANGTDGTSQTSFLTIADTTVSFPAASNFHVSNQTGSNNAVSVGTLTLNSGGRLNAGNLVVAYMDYTNGTNSASAGGTVTINNGGTLAAQTLQMQESDHQNGLHSALITVNTGGTLLLGTLTPGDSVSTTFTNTITFNGGTIKNYDASTDLVISALIGTTHPFTLGAGTPTFDISSGRTGTVSEPMGGSGSLTKIGNGTLILGATNTYTGATTITAGILQINGSTASESPIGVATEGILSGSGTVNGNVTLTGNGSINKSSGTIVGTLAVNGGYWNGTASVTGIVTSSSDTFLIGAGASLAAPAGVNVTGGNLAIASTGSVTGGITIGNSCNLILSAGSSGKTVANNFVLSGGTVRATKDNAGSGGTITSAGNKVTHTFTSSGTLTIPTAVSASELIVGGGGGASTGGSWKGGGGGGQVRNLTGEPISAGSISVVVGAGGASGATGTASSIGSNIAAAGQASTTIHKGGTSGSGNAGGTVPGNTSASGGGGSGSVGGNASGSTAGSGGVGTANTAITGLAGSYGGGGAGYADNGIAAASSGGGSVRDGNGTVNTGGGGAGGNPGGSGGSGLAVVQYAYDGAVSAGSITLNGTLNVQSDSTLDAYSSGGTLIANGVISGAGGVAIISSNNAGGVVRYNQANTYAGSTTVNAATLLLIGSITGPASVGTGGTLAGNGTVTGVATIATTGILSPGNGDVNTLNFGSTLSLNVGSTYAATITGAATNDKVIAAGALTANGTIAVTLSGYVPIAGNTFDLADAASIAGTPTFNFTAATLAAGLAWDTSEFATNGTIKVVATGATYEAWIDGFTFAPGADKTPTGDPDADGIANGVEFALGGNPATGMDTALLPTLEMVTDPDGVPAGDYLLFTYRRSDLSVSAGVTAACETDADLVAPWATAINGTEGVVVLTDNDYGLFVPVAVAPTDRVRVYVPRAANTKLFGRLRVTVPPVAP